MSKLFKELIQLWHKHDSSEASDGVRDTELQTFGKKIAKKRWALKHILMLRNAFLVADVSSEDLLSSAEDLLNSAEENLRAMLGYTAPTMASHDLTMIERVLCPRWREAEGLPRNKITLGFEENLNHEDLVYFMGLGAQISIGAYSEIGRNLSGDEISFDMIVTINL